MKTKTLGFIGGGRITRIILQAYQNKNAKFDSVIVFDPDKQTCDSLKQKFPEIEITDSPETTAKQDVVFLAVHPPVLIETLGKIKDIVHDESVVISLAPKIALDKMAQVIPASKLIRMIPNATSYINKGYNPVTFHDSFTEKEKETLLDIFDVLGKTLEVDESKLEGYAIVSAMLPTYFWFQWKKMEEIAIQTGLSENEAGKTIRATLKRAIDTYYKSGLSAKEVMDLIPVKPIGQNEQEIETILETNLLGLYQKIKS
jgi:pyrroline-5-carboxylate reductase